MGTRRASLVQRRQDPLRARYRIDPAEAWISDGAQTISACGGDPFHGVVVPANGSTESEMIPLIAGRAAIDGKPTAYVCENFACRMPVTTVEELKEQLQ